MRFTIYLTCLVLVTLITGCSYDTGNLNLMCKGNHIHTFNLNGKPQRTEQKWEESLSFRDKRRFSVERNEYLDKTCHTWTKDRVHCSFEKETKSDVRVDNFLSDYVLNRITGEVNIEISLTSRLNDDTYKEIDRDSDYYIGKCEKVESNKL